MAKPADSGKFGAQIAQVDLRILATSDLHACLVAWDYGVHKPAHDRGLSRVARLIDEARDKVANVLLFDNGDFLNGSGLGDFMAAQPCQSGVHPMIAAMNFLGYDAAALGNHEFSHGLAHLRRCAKDANFPIVCTNFTFENLEFVQHSVVLVRNVVDNLGQHHVLNIGVIGLLPAQTLVWEAAQLAGKACARAMREAAQHAADALRGAGADLVIALAHTGLAVPPAVRALGDGIDRGEEALAQAVAALPGIDAVVAGHSHQTFQSGAGFGAGAMVLPGFYGSHLGVIDLALTRAGGAWRIVRHNAQLRPISQRDDAGRLVPIVRDKPEIFALAQPMHSMFAQLATAPIGRTDQRLHSYFATITSSAALALVARAQSGALAAALAGGPFAAVPILSAVAPFKSGGRGGPENFTDLHPGALLHHHAADLYTHPNRLTGFHVTGAEVALWLERAVSKYFQITKSARDAALHNPDYPSFNCDIIFGVTYDIDLSQPPMFGPYGAVIHPDARRIKNLRYGGKPLRADQVFALASNSFRREGQAGFAGTSADRVIFECPHLLQDILRAHIAQNQPMPKSDLGHWRFVPLPGATVWIATSPIAAQVLPEIAHFRPENLGLDTGGFLRFRLHL